MRILRKRIREVVLASLPAATLACGTSPAGSSSSTTTGGSTLGGTSGASASSGSGLASSSSSSDTATSSSGSSGTLNSSSSSSSSTTSDTTASSSGSTGTSSLGSSGAGTTTATAPVGAVAGGPSSSGSSTTSGATTGSGSTGLSTTTAGFSAGSIGGTGGCNTVEYHETSAPVDGGWADGGPLPTELCGVPCGNIEPSFIEQCSATDIDGGAWDFDCLLFGNCTGRRPEGLQRPKVDLSGALGAYFARMAHLEAASVSAFLRMADELVAFGAPAHLAESARRAAGEEVRHARTMGEFAKRGGARVPRVEHPPFQSRSLEAFALENAVEGCVRETFGAAAALAQSYRAPNAELRAAMKHIATDELGHAELAWEVDAWLDTKLSAAERERVDEARRAAVTELEASIQHRDPIGEELGMPEPAVARRMLAGLREKLQLA